MPSPFPPSDEQQRIARFLDEHGRRVAVYVRNKRRLIELLNEQKQAIVNRAVTRGVDASARLIPAGVDWQGEVPEHWQVRRLKYLVRNVNESTDAKASDEVYIALENVESWTGKLTVPEGKVEFDSQVKRFQAGDILFGKLRPYLAKVTRPNRKGVCVGELLVLRPTAEEIVPQFLEQKLRSRHVIDLVNSSTFGAKMPRADWAFIGNVLIAFPSSLDEQRRILVSIHREALELDDMITRAQRQIDLIREYRTRLIADVVTGKVDMRGLALETPLVDVDGYEPLDSLTDALLSDARQGAESPDVDTIEEAADADD